MSCTRTGSTGAYFSERQPSLGGVTHALAVAVHPRWVAAVDAERPDTVLVDRAPPSRHRIGSGAGVAVAATHMDWNQRLFLRAPAAPLRVLRFSRSALLLAAGPQDAYLWDMPGDEAASNAAYESPVPPFARLPGVLPPSPAAQVVAFDASGTLVAFGGSETDGQPKLVLFRASGGEAGNAFLEAKVPCPTATRVVTACTFLHDEFEHVLIAAIHDSGRAGRVLAYDLRKQRQNGSVDALHETGMLAGAPFLSLGMHRDQGSMFLMGGKSIVRLCQIQETGASLVCTQLAEIALGDASVPVWLRSSGVSSEDPLGCMEASSAETTSDVLAVEAIGCRIQGGPAALGLSGTAAIVVTVDGVFILWGHKREAERVEGTSPLSVASVCVANEEHEFLGLFSSAFANGGDLVRITFPSCSSGTCPQSTALTCSEDGCSRQHSSKRSASFSLHRSPSPDGLSTSDMYANMVLQMPDSLQPPADPPICSVTPLGPVPNESMLGRALAVSKPPTPKTGVRQKQRAGSAPGLRNGYPSRSCSSAVGRLVTDLPVTFNRRVKSAGYGPPSEPPAKLGQPRVRVASSKSTRPPRPDFGALPSNRLGQETDDGAGVGGLGRYMAADLGPPLEQSKEHAITAYGPVTDLCYTPQATHLLVAGSDRTVSSYKLPLGAANKERKPLGLAGHEAEILSLCPSYSDSPTTGGGGGPLLLTTAADRTARLWALGGPHAGETLICFDRLKTSAKPVQKDENPGIDQVSDASFMCLDGAIALALGSRLGVYRYQLHDQDMTDDIKRLQRLGSYKCQGLLSLPREPTSGHAIAAIAANNGMISGTVVVATSTKKIHVWDVAAEKVLASIQDKATHFRPITCLRFAQPHAGCLTSESLDLFYTVAQDGIAKLWDLRSMQECRSFEGGHVHSAQRLKARLSPCLRFFCMPSEDGAVCIYDVKGGGVLGNQHVHKDAVSAVDMHPKSGCMVSGSFDGSLRFFRQKLPAARGCRRPPGGGVVERQVGKLREVEMDFP